MSHRMTPAQEKIWDRLQNGGPEVRAQAAKIAARMLWCMTPQEFRSISRRDKQPDPDADICPGMSKYSGDACERPLGHQGFCGRKS